MQTIHRGDKKGQQVITDKYPLRSLARIILVGIYTGTRHAAILSASVKHAAILSASVRLAKGVSFVDVEHSIFYRLAEGRASTNKRQTPVPIPPRLFAHIRRWVKTGVVTDHLVTWNGRPIKSVKTAFKSAVLRAELAEAATPHTLRHTCTTWLMQAGVDIWEAAGFLGMTPQTVERVYGHHHPNFMANAAHHRLSRPRFIANNVASSASGTSPSATTH